MPLTLAGPRPTGPVLTTLRQAIGRIERKHAMPGLDHSSRIPLGVPEIDSLLDGGVARGALHEIAAANEAELPAATEFALALATRSARGALGKAAFWIAESLSLRESGMPYGPGLDEIGLAPERLILVSASPSRDVLWAMEEALRCRSVSAVIGEVRSARMDVVVSRRLSLAAQERGGFGLLLRATPDPEPLAAATRWTVAAAPGARLSLKLVRNRCGIPGSWIVEFNRVEKCFQLVSADREPVARQAFDRPRQASGWR